MSNFIKAVRHIISLLDVLLFAGDRYKRYQRDKEYDRDEPPRRKGK